VLGFEILNPDPNGRCVRRNGRTFLEGHLESMVTELRDDAQEALGQRRPSGLLVIHEESRLASERVYGFSTTPEMNQYGTLVQI
jgi:hypothetical protein